MGNKKLKICVGNRIIAAILVFLLGFSLLNIQSFAAPEEEETIRLDFNIALEGEKISGTEIYNGPVEVIISVMDESDQVGLWINQQNIWMLVSPSSKNKEGEYRLKFDGDQEYNLQFKTENSETLEKLKKDISFTISSALNNTITALKKLPDPQNTSVSEVSAMQTEIFNGSNMMNDLPENQRSKIPGVLQTRMDGLRTWVESLANGNDATPPKPPKVEITSGGLSVSDCHSSGIILTVTPDYNEDSKILMDQGKGWEDFKKNSTGKYVLTISEEGMYRLRFCSVDAKGNRSTAVTKEFTIDPDVPNIISEISRLRKNVQVLPLDEYITDLEKVYLKYFSLTPPRQMLVPEETREQIFSMYDYIIDFVNFNPNTFGEDGRYIRAIGLYNNLDLGTKYIQRVEVEFTAKRETPPATVSGVAGTPLATYNIGVEPEEFEDTKLEMGKNPMKVCIQLPEDLKGKQNIEMFYIGGQTPVPMDAKVRSTEDNLVLYFDAVSAGKYVLVSQPDSKEETSK